MKKKPARDFSKWITLAPVLILVGFVLASGRNKLFPKTSTPTPTPTPQTSQLLDQISLPSPVKTSRISLEQALNQRRAKLKFFDKSINQKQLSQLLWSMQGVTADWGERTAPSAKSTYPLEIYVVAIKVDDLEPGIYRYIAGDLKPVHSLVTVRGGQFGEEVLNAAKQTSVKNAPAVLIMTGNYQKMTNAYGRPEDQNVYLEAGHAAQNIYLQVQSLGLGTVALTSFDDVLTYKLINSPVNEKVIYIIPVGYPNDSD